MTTTAKAAETCPKCGAVEDWRHALQIQWKCGSALVEGIFGQSPTCQISELEQRARYKDTEMSDWIEAAAKALSSLDGGPSFGMACEIIRRHAPPMPDWCERPTCAGWWNYIEWPTHIRRTILLRDDDLNWACGLTDQWYGPIPPAPAKQLPAQETRDAE